MSPNYFPQPWSDRFLLRLRVPVVLLALALILYFTLFLLFGAPYNGFVILWHPDNVVQVHSIRPPTNSPAAGILQPGDILLTIDGQRAYQIDWKVLFLPGQPSYRYDVQRGDEHFTVDIPTIAPDFTAVSERLAAGLVALLTWFVAALIVLFATPRNRDAWKVGLLFLGLAVCLAASEAALFGVPVGRLASEPLLPALMVAFVALALLPRQQPLSLRQRQIFTFLLAAACLMGFAALAEILFLGPRGSSVELLTGISLYDALLLVVAICGVAYVLALAIRFWYLPPSYLRLQIRILLGFTTLALVPGILFTILPRILFGAPILPWPFFILMLTLVPAGYGFVIYRRRYLNLELFATQSLTLLLVGLIMLGLYALILTFFWYQPTLAVLEPLPGYLALLFGLVTIPYTSKPCRQVVQGLIYGPHVPYQETIARFTAMLSADPQIDTLRQVLRETTSLLQVRQAAILLADNDSRFVCIENLRVPQVAPIAIDSGAPYHENLICRSTSEDTFPFLATCPWVEVALFLSVSQSPVGLLLLGPPVPDGYFDSRQVEFMRQVSSVTAVAVEAIRLFESSRAMARELMCVRDSERSYLAQAIHHDPIHRISVVINGLTRLLAEMPPCEMAEILHNYRETLRAAARELREICAGLRLPVLGQGIQWAVQDLVQKFMDDTGLETHLEVDVPADLYLPEKVSVAIYNIVLEALNNIEQHAEASTVSIRLCYGDGNLWLEVADNGRGLSLPTASLSALTRARHFGIVHMHERAGLIGAELRLQSREDSAGNGTVVTLKVPFAYRPEELWAMALGAEQQVSKG
jgi:signal transduction histidine kinase